MALAIVKEPGGGLRYGAFGELMRQPGLDFGSAANCTSAAEAVLVGIGCGLASHGWCAEVLPTPKKQRLPG